MKTEKKDEFKQIIYRECDVPMASKKGLLPCDGSCERCIACIETDINGQRSHIFLGVK